MVKNKLLSLKNSTNTPGKAIIGWPKGRYKFYPTLTLILSVLNLNEVFEPTKIIIKYSS
jgi:hypothetical protein